MKRTARKAARDGGVVLVLAMLLILVLSAIAMGAAAGVSGMMSRTGGARTAQTAGSITVSGAEGTMAFAAQNPSAFIQFVTAHGGQITMGDVAGGFFDLDAFGDGSFGRDVSPVMAATWGAEMLSALSTNRAPGFSLGEFCFRKYLARINGIYRNDFHDLAEMAEVLSNLRRNAQASALAELFVGPISCP